MKLIRFFMAAVVALTMFSSCTKDGAKGTLTINGKTYNDITATYLIERDHFFNLFLVSPDLSGYGMCDTPKALDNTVTINDDFGYGDRLFMGVTLSNGSYYEAMPAKGKQTIKKKDATHYKIDIDTTDEKGNAYKLSVLATEDKNARN